MEINGLKAIIIGGASGFARATAERIAAGGGSVAILDREGSAGPEVASSLGGTWHPTNVLDFDGISVVIDEAVEALGGLHVAVNTAGGGKAGRTLGRSGPFDLDDFRAVIDLNLVGTFNTNRLCAVHMANGDPNDDGERGVLINTSSIAAFEGQIGQVAYTASKAGIVGMTLTIARDLSSEAIRVNTILPGIFDTPLLARAAEHVKAGLSASVPFPKRLGMAEEYAQLAETMITNGYFNGEDVRLDGAIRMAPR